MKKIGMMINAEKRKRMVLPLVGALSIVLGSGIVAAASAAKIPVSEALTVFSVEGDENANIAVKEENGVRSFSTDDGKTWSETAPEGLVESEVEREDLLGGDVSAVSVEVDEDGTLNYSVDGGKTWSTEAPEGVAIEEDKITVSAKEDSAAQGTIGQ